ncbi:MAG: hypothetical protein OXC30_02680 [Alphaproteobacteria bacterium]|nr:hypothetical protein [Alphaproteobacteria bacterium]
MLDAIQREAYAHLPQHGQSKRHRQPDEAGGQEAVPNPPDDEARRRWEEAEERYRHQEVERLHQESVRRQYVRSSWDRTRREPQHLH